MVNRIIEVNEYVRQRYEELRTISEEYNRAGSFVSPDYFYLEDGLICFIEQYWGGEVEAHDMSIDFFAENGFNLYREHIEAEITNQKLKDIEKEKIRKQRELLEYKRLSEKFGNQVQ